MVKLRLQAMLVSELNHIRYLTGFTGSNALCIITLTKQFLITDRRYRNQAPEEVKGFSIIITENALLPSISEKKLIPKNARVGFESEYISAARFKTLKNLLPKRNFIPADKIIEEVSAVKDAYEIKCINTAVEITDKVFLKILSLIKPGIRECDVAAEISYWHRKYGAECDAFDPIVASGWRGALPHARASEKKIQKREMVVIDFGCRYKGYHSDLTRTVCIGNPSAKMKKIYQIVLDAQIKAIDSARSGIKANFLDSVARKHIKQNGFGRYFTHSLGHGLGIHVHDPIRLSQKSKSVLQSGNVVTIEPGIYISGLGGVRIEDDVVIRNNGCDVLTKSDKNLIIL